MLSNYGIKRMVPRLIVAAILVNVSFWIAALAVDVSNLLGASIYNIMDVQLGAIVSDGSGNNLGGWEEFTAWLLAGGVATAAGIGAAVTIGTYGFIGALSLLIPGAIAALLAFLTVVFLLIARQAIIIMLVILSPLAFVAYLLPNTEEWFTRWRKLFFAMLLLYPTLALLFGGGQLVAEIIRSTTDDGLLYVASLVIVAIPAFLALGILRASSNILGKIAGFTNNPNRGPLDRARKGSQNFAERQKNFKFGDRVNKAEAIRKGEGGAWGAQNTRRRKARAWVAGIGSANKITAEEKDKYAKIAADASHRNYVAERASTDKDYATSLGGGSEKLGSLIESYAIQEVRKEEKKDIEAKRSKIEKVPTGEYDHEGMGKTPSTFVSEMNKAASQRDGITAAAYAAEIAKRGSGEQFHEAMIASQQIQDQETRRLVQSELIENMRENHFGVSDTMRSKMATGTLDSEFHITKPGQPLRMNGNGQAFSNIYYESLDQRLEKKLNAEGVVSLKPHDMTRAKEMIATGELSDAALQSMVNNMAAAEANPNTAKEIKGETEELFIKTRALMDARNKNRPEGQKIVVREPAQQTATPQTQPTQAPQPESQSAPANPTVVRGVEGGQYEQNDGGLYIRR